MRPLFPRHLQSGWTARSAARPLRRTKVRTVQPCAERTAHRVGRFDSVFSDSHSNRCADRGFALLLSITLLAFLLLLLLGLAAFARIETVAALMSQRQAQAREHALF